MKSLLAFALILILSGCVPEPRPIPDGVDYATGETVYIYTGNKWSKATVRGVTPEGRVIVQLPNRGFSEGKTYSRHPLDVAKEK